MCGIVGQYAFNGKPVSLPDIISMRDRLTHRGPDAAGFWISGERESRTGHRRLSIVDLSDSALQPMSNADCTIQLVFNGEIYNHQDLHQKTHGRRPKCLENRSF